MSSMTIRPIDPDEDARQVVALLYATNPLLVTNADEWRHRRSAIPERVHLTSLAAEVDGRIVGTVDAGLELFGSGTVARLELRVEPTSRGRGVGSELYRLGVDHVLNLGATRVLASFVETPAGVSFARSHGWVEQRAERLSTLDPRTVSERPDGAFELVAARHLYPRDLHRIDEEATGDLPAVERVAAVPYDEWLEFVWHNPLFTRDGSFGAVIDGRVVAVSLLLANFDWGRAVSMFTGTSREFRGRGLAHAVKLASTRWAGENGITLLVTTNDETNVSMLAVNRRLGYQPAGRRVEYLAQREWLLRERSENLRRDPHRRRHVFRRVAIAAVVAPQPREVGEGACAAAAARRRRDPGSPTRSTARRNRGRASARTPRRGSGSRAGTRAARVDRRAVHTSHA